MSFSSSDVYIGFWTNWSQGQILGGTLTVTSDAGAILTAVLALAVQFAGSHLWHLIAFTIHRIRSTPVDCHAIRRQQQIVLRNATSPGEAALLSAKLVWVYWCSPTSTSAKIASLLIALLASLCAISGIAAGVFSSQLLNTSNIDILLASPHCGFWTSSIPSGSVNNASLQDVFATTFGRFSQQALTSGVTFARQCYNESSPGTCDVFAIPKIDWSTEYNVSCPVDETMCLGSAMKLDTGLLNSNTIFGLNLPRREQFEFRRVTTCFPVAQDGFTSVTDWDGRHVKSSTSKANLFTNYHYGPLHQGYEVLANYTTSISSYATRGSTQYSISPRQYFSNPEQLMGNFDAIDPLKRPDQDLALLFVSSNNIIYGYPCDDPVFAAHRTANLSEYVRGASGVGYIADNPAGVVGCAEQYQLCKPADRGSHTCTSLTGASEAYFNFTTMLNPTPLQNATLSVLYEAISLFYASIGANGYTHPTNLLASDSLVSRVQPFLPDNQWQIEVQNWHAAALSMLQDRLILHVTGPSESNAAARQFIDAPVAPEDRVVCNAQRVRTSQGFSNISVFGLAFVVALSGVIIFVSVVLDSVGQRRSWGGDAALQLLRQAYEGQTPWKWTRIKSEIPRPEIGCLLGPLRDNYQLATAKVIPDPDLDSLLDVSL